MVTGRFGPIPVRTRVVSVLFHFGQVVLARVVSARFHGWIVSVQFWRVVSALFILDTVEHQWLEHLWDHENMFETGVVRVNECLSWRKVSKHNGDLFPNLFIIEVYCVFSLKSPHRGDSNVYIQYTISKIKKKITPDYFKSAVLGLFDLGTSERVRNS